MIITICLLLGLQFIIAIIITTGGNNTFLDVILLLLPFVISIIWIAWAFITNHSRKKFKFMLYCQQYNKKQILDAAIKTHDNATHDMVTYNQEDNTNNWEEHGSVTKPNNIYKTIKYKNIEKDALISFIILNHDAHFHNNIFAFLEEGK